MTFFPFRRKVQTQILIYIYMSTHLYKHMHIHSTSVSNFKRLSPLDLKIYEVGHQERLAVDEDVVSH
jgi:hypothetical protein